MINKSAGKEWTFPGDCAFTAAAGAGPGGEVAAEGVPAEDEGAQALPDAPRLDRVHEQPLRPRPLVACGGGGAAGRR